MHVSLISKYWDDIINDKITLTKQDESKATIWPGRKPNDGEIFSNMTMDEADKMVRLLHVHIREHFIKKGIKL